MEHAPEHSDALSSSDAWEQAQQYGIDTSGLQANLNRTVLERIRNHDRALTLALALREAMGRPRDRESVRQLKAIRDRLAQQEPGAAFAD